MALHDYWCPACGRVLPDVNVPIAIGQTAGAPICPDGCRRGEPQALPVKMSPIPGIGRMDAGGVKGVAFKKFTTYNHRNELVEIDSTHSLRRLERESEQAARNGEGQPLRFRMWSQDRSNKEVNTFGPTPEQTPDRAAVEKFGKAIRSATEPDTAFGPGVSEANASALPMAGGE
jgi:hypothetical protein